MKKALPIPSQQPWGRWPRSGWPRPWPTRFCRFRAARTRWLPSEAWFPFLRSTQDGSAEAQQILWFPENISIIWLLKDYFRLHQGTSCEDILEVQPSRGQTMYFEQVIQHSRQNWLSLVSQWPMIKPESADPSHQCLRKFLGAPSRASSPWPWDRCRQTRRRRRHEHDGSEERNNLKNYSNNFLFLSATNHSVKVFWRIIASLFV